MAIVLVVVQVVRAHYAPCAAFLHGGAEGREVDFAQRTVADDDVDLVAVHLVVVQRVVLDTRGDAVRLQSADVRHNHARRQQRVFAHVLEVASAQRRAQHVDAGAQEHVLAAVEGFLAERLAIGESRLRIPRCGETRQRGKGHARVVGLPGLHPFVPKHIGAHAVRPVVGPELGYAQARHAGRAELALGVDYGDFLLRSHPPECVFDALLYWFCVVKIHGQCLPPRSRGRAHGENGCCQNCLHMSVFVRLCFHRTNLRYFICTTKPNIDKCLCRKAFVKDGQ